MSTKTNAPTIKQIKAWWPGVRGRAIITMMKAGLPYFRAVKRTRRYFLEGKLVA